MSRYHLYNLNPINPQTYCRIASAILREHRTSSILLHESGDSLILRIPETDDWTGTLTRWGLRTESYGQSLAVGEEFYDFYSQGGASTTVMVGRFSGRVRWSDLYQGAPVRLQAEFANERILSRTEVRRLARRLKSTTSEMAPKMRGSFQLSGYANLNFEQFCHLIWFVRDQEILDLGGGSGEVAWALLCLGAKRVISIDCTSPAETGRVAEQLRQLPWAFEQHDLSSGLPAGIPTQRVVISWPAPSECKANIAWEKILPFCAEVFYIGQTLGDRCGTPGFWALLSQREIRRVSTSAHGSIIQYGPGRRVPQDPLLLDEVSGFVHGLVPANKPNASLDVEGSAPLREILNAWCSLHKGPYPEGDGKPFGTR